MANFHEDVSFGDDRVEVTNLPRYKGVKDQRDRIAFLSTSIKRVYTHYHNERYFRCLSTETDTAICCQHLKAAQQRFGVIIFHYTTDPEGEIIDEKKLQGSLKFWPFTEKKYTDLSGFHRKWPLLNKGFKEEQCDLEILCSDDQYQKMTFTPCREAHWKSSQDWYDKLTAKEADAQKRLGDMLARSMPEDEVKALLDLTSVTSMEDIQPQGDDIDIEDLLPTE